MPTCHAFIRTAGDLRLPLPSLFLGLLHQMCLTAQPSISASEHLPAIGTSRTLHFQNLTQAPPPGGADVTWDFSTMLSGGSETVNYVEPSETGPGALYPNATVAELASDGSLRYFSLGPDGLVEHGVALTACTYVWSNTLLLLPTSITYNQDYADDYTGACDLGLGSILETGEVEILADGWGSLIMATGTYTNVLRVRTTRNYATGLITPNLFFRQETLDYYAPGVSGPVLQTVRLFQNVNGNLTLLSNTANFILDPSLGSPQHVVESICIAPNPATSYVTIEWGNAPTGAGRIEILDARGAQLRTYPIIDGKSQVLDISNLKPGYYSVRLFATDRVLTSRLIKL